MRAARLVLVGILLSSACATSAPARPRIPGALLGAMVGTVGGIMALRHRHAAARYHHGHPAPRVATAPPEAPAEPRPDAAAPISAPTAAAAGQGAQPDAAAPNPATRQAAIPTAKQATSRTTNPAANQPANQAAWTGPLFWPRLADDVIDYLFWPSGNDDRFWTYGYGEIVDGALRPANQVDRSADRRGRGQTTAVASGAGVVPGPCAGQSAAQSADAVIAHIEEAIQPTEAQKAIIVELRAAALRGLGYIDTACPTDQPQTPTARLDAMEDRLWAARQALLVARAPVAKLYGALSDEQKARLNGPAGQPPPGGDRGCGQPADLPAARIEQRVRPSNEQRPGLEALRMTSMGLARLLMASCPSRTPATPVERLDAADKRLNSLLYAVVALRAPLDGFYASLSDQQKTRFNASR